MEALDISRPTFSSEVSQTSAAGGPEEAAPAVVSSELWHEYVSLYLTIARQRGDDLSVLLLDINSVKATNDELGHSIGTQLINFVHGVSDEIPKQLRTQENGTERPADLVMAQSYKPLDMQLPDGMELPGPQSLRIGGDEFGVLLPGTDNAGAHVVAERLQETVDDALELPENLPLKERGVGVAVGVYTFKAGDNASHGLHQADMASYREKLEQARPLSPDEEVDFWMAIEHLEKAGVRPRDVPKYIEKLGASAIARAFRDQPNPDQLTLEIPAETDQES